MTTPTAQQFLTALRSYLGVIESPLGSNQTRVGVEFGWNGVPWCAETISVASQRSGFGRQFWSASTDQWEANARAGVQGARWVSASVTPSPGDIAVWDWVRDGTANHVSVVETVRSDGYLITLGGNENNQCQRAVRSKYGLRGYIRLPFLIVETRPVLSPGSTGPFVAELQSKLNIATGSKLTITSPAGFGPKTAEAVQNFKRFMGLSPADPIVGPRTWGVLDYVVSLRD